jgi:hypothetical protein
MNLNKTPPGFKPNAGALGRVVDNTTYVGFVKYNQDVQRMGRLGVYIPELGGDPRDPESWFTVSYASPFAGATSAHKTVKDSKTMDGSQTSYGMWMVPPDLENEVLVTFVNGNTARGFWFACVWQQNMNHMVPGLASNITTEPPDKQTQCGSLPPVTEYNKNSTVNADEPQRPVFAPLATGLSKQGLFSDLERGVSSTSARREAPSHVFGFLTPRGNSIHVDDNPVNEFIRMRTRSGAQVLVHETTGYVYINSKDGNSWIEVSDVGIDIYSAGAVSVRTEGTLNLHADKDVNLEADGNLNLRAGKNITMQAPGTMNVLTNGGLILETGGKASINAGSDVLFASGGALRLGAAGDISQASGGMNVRSASVIHDNTSTAAPAPSPAAPTLPTATTVASTTGSPPCYAEASRQSITNRFPSHEPWGGHPKRGIAIPETHDAIAASPEEVGTPNQVTGSGKVLPEAIPADTSPKTTACNAKISQTVLTAIRAAAGKTGMDFGILMAVCHQESSFNPSAGASTSSAKGLYQFTSGTWASVWKQYGAANQVGQSDWFDARSNALLGAYFSRDNGNLLRKQGIDPVSAADYYMVHFLGVGGGPKFLKAVKSDPNTLCSTVVSAAGINANRSIFIKNGQMQTVGQVYNYFRNKLDPLAKCYEKYKTPAA